jgi:hypothetical protein
VHPLPEGILKKHHDAKEYRLQVACIRYLRGQVKHGRNIINVARPFPELYYNSEQLFTHIYQGRGDPKEGFFLKELGQRTGIFDIMIWPSFIGFIDLKVNGELSLSQKNFDASMKGKAKTATARSVAEFRDILKGWGLKCKKEEVLEPAISLEEKQKRYLDMMKPL